MKLTWWCSATGAPWTGQWQPYPGAWLAVVTLLAAYALRVRRQDVARPHGWKAASYAVGVLLLWAAIDWPIGTLGASYLVTAHTVSWILLSLVAPPLLLLGWPAGDRRHLEQPAGFAKVGRLLRRPVLSLAIFNLVLAVTHLPSVVDGLMPLQLGSFAIDLAWLLAGLILWRPVMGAIEGPQRLSYPQRLMYLFVATIPPTLPAAFMTFADYPLYGLYELAPRVHGIEATHDQQVAGLTMKIIGDVPLWLAFGVVFFRWARQEEGNKGPPPSK